MKVISAATMRELDGRTIVEAGVPGEVLMERAGKCVAGTVLDILYHCGGTTQAVLVVAGCGNNGGDAFVAARHLAWEGIRVETWLAGSLSAIKGDSRAHLQKLLDTGLKVREMASAGEWAEAQAQEQAWRVVVDGVLGTGISGPPREVPAAAISFINESSRRSLVVSIDLPSGMNADTGASAGAAVVADFTVAMGFPKAGFVTRDGMERTGVVTVADIGIPPAFSSAAQSGVEMIVRQDIEPLFARRPRSAHKGTFGHVLVVGGSRGFSGAASMATMAALRSGAGLVTTMVPRSIAPQVACVTPEAMVHGVEETESGCIAGDLWSGVQPDRYDAILIGPGLGNNPQSRLLVQDLLRRSKKPIVIDADALGVQKCEERLIKSAYCPVVITPHPREMSNFMGREVSAIQADREAAARDAAAATNAVVVLKGAGTVVARKTGPAAVNSTGNPGMATAGMGDVLAGLLAGLLAQGLEIFDAARAAVWVHGRAGDRVALRIGQAGMIAGDVTGEIPAVLKEVANR